MSRISAVGRPGMLQVMKTAHPNSLWLSYGTPSPCSPITAPPEQIIWYHTSPPALIHDNSCSLRAGIRMAALVPTVTCTAECREGRIRPDANGRTGDLVPPASRVYHRLYSGTRALEGDSHTEGKASSSTFG